MGCLKTSSVTPTTCPVCKSLLQEGEHLGLLLTPPGSSPVRKALAQEILVIVCPHCGGMFFDPLHLEVLQIMKKDGMQQAHRLDDEPSR